MIAAQIIGVVAGERYDESDVVLLCFGYEVVDMTKRCLIKHPERRLHAAWIASRNAACLTADHCPAHVGHRLERGINTELGGVVQRHTSVLVQSAPIYVRTGEPERVAAEH